MRLLSSASVASRCFFASGQKRRLPIGGIRSEFLAGNRDVRSVCYDKFCFNHARLFSSALQSKSTSQSKKKKKRSRRNLQRTKTPKQLFKKRTATNSSHRGKSKQNDPSKPKIEKNPTEFQSSVAYSIVDQWDRADDQFESKRKSNTTFQLQRFLDKQEEFCETLHHYRLDWYPKSNLPETWKDAMELEHPNPSEQLPWLEVNWQKIVDSEDRFRRVCAIHHDLFVACSSYLGDLSEDLTEERMECEQLLSKILPNWERLRRERALLVEAHRPSEDEADVIAIPSDATPTPNSTIAERKEGPDASYENNQWVGWLKGMISGSEQASDEKIAAHQILVIAHFDPECAPNHYHYTKLVGRLYFHYLPLERHNRSNPFHLFPKNEHGGSEYKQSLTDWEEKRMDILAKRASQMQSIVDQSLLPLVPNRNNNGTALSKPQHLAEEDDTSQRVLTDKIVRLLIRSYLDMESLPAAQQAERVYHRHPNHRKRLLWYVTMCYLKVITTHKKALGRDQDQEEFLKLNQECATAAKRICELVSSKHAKEAREFQHCSTIAFEALAILPNYGRRGLKGYFDRVHSLGILKFGPKVWEALLNDDSTSPNRSRRRKRKTHRGEESEKPSIDLSESLHSKDHRILNYLIQIYSHEDKDLPRALRLLHVSLDLYSPYDLKESLDRSTFHKLLKKLSEQRRKNHQQQKHAACSEFDTALSLLDSMVSEDEWFPTEETFRILFSMIPYCEHPGLAADQLRSKIEACRFLSGDSNAPPLLNPLESSNLTLRAWLQTHQTQANPSQRALAVLKGMQVESNSLFDDVGKHVAPTAALYSLALEVYSRDTGSPRITHDAAMETFKLLRKDDELLEATCTSLLGVVGNFSKNQSEDSLLLNKIDATKQVWEAVDKPHQSTIEFLQEQASYLRLRHPDLYEEHLEKISFLPVNKEEDEVSNSS